ncbi:hypothetical protein HYFRA_00005398 [Hymenoscyphus fraxineus]|uniref:pectinesterase n=1 Tax=Hymenoscyphus fraxineus TaxID=746836 RepID=A0A9N9LDK6_9HELO|nr:hypothetical protein HYFRA_00005398 [Hymenoscyphus fraxineus]
MSQGEDSAAIESINMLCQASDIAQPSLLHSFHPFKMKSSLGSLCLRALALVATVAALPSPEPNNALVKRASRTSPPSGCLTVGGSGTYSDINAALSALGTGTTAKCIFIYSGTYTVTEQIHITYKGPLTLYGYTTDTGSFEQNVVNFQRSLKSADAGSLDKSATMNVVASNFKAYNINFKNTFGKGAQAVAVCANGDRQGYYGCGFYGYQDTLYAKAGHQYYSNCYMEGAVDYIFGNAAAWFGECTIASNGNGAITATSRRVADEATWYVIDHSTVTAAAGQSLAGKVYLGRPWRAFSRVMYQNSVLTNVVAPRGWSTMYDGATPLFYEYNNSGDGADTSKRQYESESNGTISKDTVFGSGWKDWIDTSY